MVDDFVARCRRAGLVSLIEPVSRKPRDGRSHDLQEGILAAARELGDRGQDIYKAEVPLQGAGDEAEVRRRCAELTKAIRSRWVVLSSRRSARPVPDRRRMGVQGGRQRVSGRTRRLEEHDRCRRHPPRARRRRGGAS